ncbi:MAG: molybdopterin oxidoreductase, partial [Syntrophobacterales bacterium]
PMIAYERMAFDHADNKYRFPEAIHGEEGPTPEFPLRLLTLIRRDAIHSQISSKKQMRLPTVWIAPDSPALKDVDLGEDVYLVSPLARLRVEVKALPGLHGEAVIYRRGDWIKHGGGVNRLVDAVLTDVGDGASFYSQCVRVENQFYF